MESVCYSGVMRSKLGEQCREELLEICRRMSPAERLQAFVNQSKVLVEIYRAGEAVRKGQRIGQQRSNPASNS